MKGTIIVRFPEITDADLAAIKKDILARVEGVEGVRVEGMTTD